MLFHTHPLVHTASLLYPISFGHLRYRPRWCSRFLHANMTSLPVNPQIIYCSSQYTIFASFTLSVTLAQCHNRYLERPNVTVSCMHHSFHNDGILHSFSIFLLCRKAALKLHSSIREKTGCRFRRGLHVFMR